MSIAKHFDNTWSIVLAAGEGERLKPFVREWLGCEKPKQFCSFIGTRSLLQHTLDRADQITPPSQKITVITRYHQQSGWVKGLEEQEGKVLAQPRNLGTGPAIFLPLSYIKRTSPDASVVLFPSDHFIYPEERFLDVVRVSLELTETLTRRLIVLGVSASRAELDYGFIQIGDDLGRIHGLRLTAAEHFWEKPDPDLSRQVLASGALYNTFILTFKAEFLWSLGYECFPTMMTHLDDFIQTIGTPAEEAALELLYDRLPSSNFSSGLLEIVPEEIAVLELAGVLWSDWGRPERILESLAAIGRPPVSPLAART